MFSQTQVMLKATPNICVWFPLVSTQYNLLTFREITEASNIFFFKKFVHMMSLYTKQFVMSLSAILIDDTTTFLADCGAKHFFVLFFSHFREKAP